MSEPSPKNQLQPHVAPQFRDFRDHPLPRVCWPEVTVHLQGGSRYGHRVNSRPLYERSAQAAQALHLQKGNAALLCLTDSLKKKQAVLRGVRVLRNWGWTLKSKAPQQDLCEWQDSREFVTESALCKDHITNIQDLPPPAQGFAFDIRMRSKG
ncbi:hypothetical protein llap_14290 [Limosa lapponica baueri]|uniref:Uncharacterized protein n=1 Tax=Limosa lapponica baueri TaxID=1758121 RepID=A0A2I0TNL8_LIMLA|nr:hypothetical protein llap_14290 [Limosa lapponica baueri]